MPRKAAGHSLINDSNGIMRVERFEVSAGDLEVNDLWLVVELFVQ